jgi:hypothetical protein
VTVAVKVTGWPVTGAGAGLVTATAVDAGSTTWGFVVSGPDEDPKDALPEYEAIIVWFPTLAGV